MGGQTTGKLGQAGDFRLTGFLSELKRRNVLRIAGLYLVGAWLVTQICTTVALLFNVPEWLLRNINIGLAIGFMLTLILTWHFELGPYYMKRTSKNISFQRPISPELAHNIERLILMLFVLALAFFSFNLYSLKSNIQEPNVMFANTSVEVLAGDTKSLQDSAVEFRRLGQYNEALKSFDVAIKNHRLDDSLVYERAVTAFFAQRLAEAEKGFHRALSLNSQNTQANIKLAELTYYRSGDAGKALAILQGEQADILLYRIDLLASQRKFDDALTMVQKYQTVASEQDSNIPMIKGIVLAKAGNYQAALPLLYKARSRLHIELEQLPPLSDQAQSTKHTLALVEAYIGNERIARDLTLEALTLMPPEKDATLGAIGVGRAANTYAVLGRADLVVEMLERLRKLPSTDLRTSAATLRADPIWDNVRDDSRFQSEVDNFPSMESP